MAIAHRFQPVFDKFERRLQQSYMKTGIEHLPEHKQKELQLVCDLIVKVMRPEMVLLFGSYATNRWVEDKYVEDGITYEYKSDFDLLVISKVELGPKRISKWHRLEDEVRKQQLNTPVSLIHHGIKYVNREIRKNSYFFTDILKEGILLYDSGNYRLEQPRKLNEQQLQKKAKEDFDQWFESANGFYRQFTYAQNDKDYKIAAFLLHQSVERYYTALLLVFTGYRPKLHDIEKLGEMAAPFHKELKKVFPKNNEEERVRFDLLKRAYIDARYKKNYTIAREDLEYLSHRVELLKGMVEASCKLKIGA